MTIADERPSPLEDRCVHGRRYTEECRECEAEGREDEACALDDDYGAEPFDGCSNPGGHRWVYTGTQYGGDDERWGGEGRCYCEFCGADGDA